MTTLREWKERRPASDIKQTIEFYHPAFGYYRVVNKLFQEAMFGGNLYQPAAFDITEPTQNGSAIISLVITFLQGAEEVRNTLKKWSGRERMAPVTCKYQQWSAIGDVEPLKTWSLFVKDVGADGTNVTVNAGKTNPLTLANPIIYTTEGYPGLINI